MTSAFL